MKCTEMEHNGPIEILVNFQIYIFNNGWRSPFICKTLETYQQITKHYLQQLFSRGKKKINFLQNGPIQLKMNLRIMFYVSTENSGFVTQAPGCLLHNRCSYLEQ